MKAKEHEINSIKTEKKLFDLWEKETEKFVRDGIFSNESFVENKILFILRDAHIVKPPYDIREIIKSPYSEGKTWNNIARWTRALLDNAQYEEVEQITPTDLSSQLKRVAAINLKKEAGGAHAERIKEFSNKHRIYIKKQIEIINPDIIIACGTFINIKRDVYDDNRRCTSRVPNTTYRVYTIMINDKKIPVIEFCHPQYNKKNESLVEDMLKIRDFVLNNNN